MTESIKPKLAPITQPFADRIFELLVVFIISTSFLGLVAALAGYFKAELIVVLSLLVTLIYNQVLGVIGVVLNKAGNNFNWFYILVIILVGLFFRLTPYHYVFGGQDQGVYVNIASSIERSGTVDAIDPVIDEMVGKYLDQYVKDNYGPFYLPGVYEDRQPSGEIDVDFQFYHLFPVWMATFEGLFGSESGVYALTFLSIISLLFCYCFVLVVTGNQFYSFVAALLLALNPLHAFFSKWPVTEVPTLVFSLSGFTCFAIYWFSESDQLNRNRRFLILSALSFGCLFVTRISGFMYIPALFAVFSSVMIGEENKAKTNPVALWVVLVFLLYGISVWYGLVWSTHYSNDIYEISFSKIFGDEWRVGVYALALIFAIAFSFIIYSAQTSRFKKTLFTIFDWISGKLGLLFILIFATGIFKIYQLGFTDHYSAHPGVGLRFGLADKKWTSVAASSLVVTAISVCPLVFLIFSSFMLFQWKNYAIRLTQFFLLCFFAYIALLQFVVPYQPYYDRYLLSELVPYMIIYVVWGWSMTKPGRTWNIISSFLIISLVYSSALTLLHFGKEEQRGAYDGLAKISDILSDNDLILLHGQYYWPPIKTSLVYKFGKKVAYLTDDSLHNADYLSFLIGSHDDVYILSSGRPELEKLNYQGIKRVTYDSFNRKHLPPSRVNTRSEKFSLFKFDESGGTSSLKMYRNNLITLPGTTGNISSGKKITSGNSGFLVFGPYASFPPGKYRLIVQGLARNAPTAWVDIVSNQGMTQHARYPLKSNDSSSNVLAEGGIVLAQSVNDLEVRVYVGEKDEVVLEGYELNFIE